MLIRLVATILLPRRLHGLYTCCPSTLQSRKNYGLKSGSIRFSGSTQVLVRTSSAWKTQMQISCPIWTIFAVESLRYIPSIPTTVRQSIVDDKLGEYMVP